MERPDRWGAVIVDIHKPSIVHSFVTTRRVLWSPDGDRICYAVVHGKAIDPESYDYRFDLVSVGLRSGQRDIVFSGEQGNWVTPLEWTDTRRAVSRIRGGCTIRRMIPPGP